jgi:hypothetical protein
MMVPPKTLPIGFASEGSIMTVISVIDKLGLLLSIDI